MGRSTRLQPSFLAMFSPHCLSFPKAMSPDLEKFIFNPDKTWKQSRIFLILVKMLLLAGQKIRVSSANWRCETLTPLLPNFTYLACSYFQKFSYLILSSKLCGCCVPFKASPTEHDKEKCDSLLQLVLLIKIQMGPKNNMIHLNFNQFEF